VFLLLQRYLSSFLSITYHAYPQKQSHCWLYSFLFLCFQYQDQTQGLCVPGSTHLWAMSLALCTHLLTQHGQGSKHWKSHRGLLMTPWWLLWVSHNSSPASTNDHIWGCTNILSSSNGPREAVTFPRGPHSYRKAAIHKPLASSMSCHLPTTASFPRVLWQTLTTQQSQSLRETPWDAPVETWPKNSPSCFSDCTAVDSVDVSAGKKRSPSGLLSAMFKCMPCSGCRDRCWEVYKKYWNRNGLEKLSCPRS
jgi:hypothetical protein